MAKTVFLLSIVVVGTLGGYGLFMVAMGTTSPIVVVTSGSMEPTIYRGDLLVIQARAVEDIHLLDIIVFNDTSVHYNGPVVHRVVEIEIIDGEYFFTTKGDNNSVQDSGVRSHDEIFGVVISTIPWIGNFSLALRSEYGIVFIVILFIAIIIVPEVVCKSDDEEETSTEPEPPSVEPETEQQEP
ncbi:MAG: signal peptidase I [Candidatus Thorarchaeota archaeon]